MDMRTVMVGWRKGWATAAHTYLVEVADGAVWLGRLGKGGAYWQPRPSDGFYLVHTEGQSLPERAAGTSLGMAIGGKALEKFRAEIDRNEQRYRAEGRSALAGDKRTCEWPLAEFAEARVVDKLPGTCPPAMRGLGPGFLEVRLGGRLHYFAAAPQGSTVEEVRDVLVAAHGR